jgi:hypothetical protein
MCNIEVRDCDLIKKLGEPGLYIYRERTSRSSNVAGNSVNRPSHSVSNMYGTGGLKCTLYAFCDMGANAVPQSN